ncbi:MAG TPA: flagellar export protein FliJ [Epulopiscium sp.]|nr:flagellar export protein FliJ [Candidatus Epulonipiscium sp.]
MANFKYELENVLNVREKLQNIKQKEYADALELLKKEKQIKKQINHSLNNSRHAFKSSISDYIDPKKIKSQQNYHMLLEDQYQIATEKVEIAKGKTEKQRIELLNAMKNKKTLEILKEKRFEQFIEQEKKDEQQVVDEIVSFAYKKSK